VTTTNGQIAQVPRFLITIDTEGDNFWSRPKIVTTKNSSFLARFQSLCERYGLKPTYLTDVEMAMCPVFCDFGRDVLKRGTGEIGMHLHAWNSPPIVPLTDDDFLHHPYLIEYPKPIIQDKIAFMTDLLERTFETKMKSHRAGRWAFDPNYARLLVQYGYSSDCSITPHVSWRQHGGDPRQSGGTDYTAYPESPYFVDLEDIARPGTSPLLEIPVTIIKHRSGLVDTLGRHLPQKSLAGRAFNKVIPPVLWLRPELGNIDRMLRILAIVVQEGRPCAEFMLHSSELMPGGSPLFRTEKSIELLYENLECLFAQVRPRFRGATLTEFHDIYCQTRADGSLKLRSDGWGQRI
jgi:hypothetical protein